MTEHTEKMDFEPMVAASLTPGEMLRKAREAKKLSHIDVAKLLKLRVQWVVDIENDHYQDASALIYVHGYLRSYARLVDVSPDKIINAFQEMNFDEPFKARKSSSSGDDQFIRQQPVLPYRRSRKNMGSKIASWIVALILIVLVTLVVLWWRGQKEPEISMKSSVPASSVQIDGQSSAADSSPMPVVSTPAQTNSVSADINQNNPAKN